MKEKKGQLRWLWLSIIIIILDQATKYLAAHHLLLGEPKVLLPFFNFTLAFNTGSAFSFLHQAGGWQVWFFSGLASGVSIILLVWLASLTQQKRLLACGIVCILGGAIGNLIDRVRFGYVIDFLDFHWQHWHWPIFNIADTAVFIGACLIIFDHWKHSKK
ncbi:MAG: lipoprotein signal peptidase [Legionellales bacterium]|nr:lipoprotein signal peptidase [Legionellales bacterium]